MVKQWNRFAQSLMWSTAYMNDLSLYTGKMGLSIFFFEYGKYCSNSLYHNFANELIEEIYEDITDEIPLSFEKGLSGIGWGMFFLIKKKFVEGNIDEILSPIDELVLSYLVENKTSTSYNDIKKYIIIRSESTCFQDRMNQLAFKNIRSLSSKYDLDDELLKIITRSDVLFEKKESGLMGNAGQILRQIYNGK